MGIQAKLLGTPDSVSHAVAQEHGQTGVAVYWRPGCSFCMVLATRVRKFADRAVWVNMWQDPEASAWVKSVNSGNEVAPTVLIDGVPHTNPSPALVKQRLEQVPA